MKSNDESRQYLAKASKSLAYTCRFHCLIDYLLFYAPLKNFSLIWRRHHCRWRAAKLRLMLGAQGLWARRDFYCATPTVTRDLGFSGLIRRTTPFSRLLRHAWGYGAPILIRIIRAYNFHIVTAPSFAIYEWQLGQKEKYVCLLSPDRPYFFTPTLKLFIGNFLKIVNILEILSFSGTKWNNIINNSWKCV
jgi:hypothetical protein